MDRHLVELKAIVASTKALNSHVTFALDSTTDLPSFGDKPVPNAIALSVTAASLIKAQTTKLSLLIINKPFTPSAINSVLKTLSSECIPALLTGVQIAKSSRRYPQVIVRTLRTHVGTIVTEFDKMMDEIPVDERGIDLAQTTGRDTLASTGVIWAACDAVIQMRTQDAGDIAYAEGKKYQALVHDASNELSEWVENAEKDGQTSKEKVGDDEDASNDESSDQDDFDFEGEKCPANMKSFATKCHQFIKLIDVFCQMGLKRRIKKFPGLTARTKTEELPETEVTVKLDSLLEKYKDFANLADEIAGNLYELDFDGAQEQARLLSMQSLNTVPLVFRDWSGGEDELSKWFTSQWEPMMKKTSKDIQDTVIEDSK